MISIFRGKYWRRVIASRPAHVLLKVCSAVKLNFTALNDLNAPSAKTVRSMPEPSRGGRVQAQRFLQPHDALRPKKYGGGA